MKNEMYEQALNRCGVQWRYEDKVDLDEINVAMGRTMQARLTPIDMNLVEEYAVRFKDGETPPPLLLWKHGKSLYVPLDGNQRIQAAQNAKWKGKFSAYIVTTDDRMTADRLCWQFNNLVNGRRLSYEECLMHAISFVRKYGQPVNQTAKDWGVKPWELAAKVREMDLRDIAERKGISTKNVPANTIVVMNPLTAIGEDVYLKVAKIVADTGIGHDPVKELVSDVGKARTADAKAELIESFKLSAKVLAAKEATKGGKLRVNPNNHPRNKLHKLLDQLEDLFGEYKDDAFKATNKTDRERYAGASLTVCNRLIKLYGLGALLKGQGVA